MIFKVFILVFFVTSCSTVSSERKEQSQAQPVVSQKIVQEIKDINIYNGKVKFVSLDVNLADSQVDVICKNADKKEFKYLFYVTRGVAKGYIVENYFASPEKRDCFINDELVMRINSLSFNYKKEKLNVAKNKVDLSKKDLARVQRERRFLAKVYSNSEKRFLFETAFRKPLNSFITSYYGNQRIFNNKKRSQHLGNDFRAAVGVPIPVANRGRVVYVGDLFYAGKVVIVDHGMNIYSYYGHLSKILASKGDIVNKGDIVGNAGMTGRVTGPHLHWGVKINGHNIDGFSLVEESQKHF